MKVKQLIRFIKINHILAKYHLDDIMHAAHIFRPLRLIGFFPRFWYNKYDIPRGERLRLALQDLGPIFVKFGQILSTRHDLMPEDITEYLAKLQNQVTPISNEQASSLIQQAYGERAIPELFSYINNTPLASASVSQVHDAQLVDGSKVVIKIIRPGIKQAIKRDVELLHTLALLAERYWSRSKYLHPSKIVQELEKHLFDELDMMREASSASQLRRNFKDGQLLYVPKIYWSLTKDGLLVQERIYGIPIGNIYALKEHKVNFKRLAEVGVEIFFVQVFKHSFFHADMHPGNIMVDASNPEQPLYIAIDFGIMGTLAPNDQNYLAENFLAFFNHDYRRVAELHIQSGWVPPNTRLDEFEAAIRSVCEPIFAKPLKEISFGQLLLRLLQTTRRFNMEIQPQLILLQKTLFNIEGLGRRFYPELDLWKTAKPILEQWTQQKMGWKAALDTFKQEVPNWANTLPTLPLMIYEISKQAKHGTLKMQLSSQEIKQIKQEVHDASYRSAGAISGATLIIGATVIKDLNGYAPSMFASIPVLSWIFGFFGGLLLYISLSNKR